MFQKIKIKLLYCFMASVLCANSATASENHKLACLQYTGDYWQVYIYDSNTLTSRQATNTDYDIATVSWLDNGDKIFISGVQGDAAVLDLKSGDIEKISLPSETNDAVISPDGRYIAYSSVPENGLDNKLWLYDTQSRSARPLFHELKGRQYDPKWSDDGRYLVFTSGATFDAYNIRIGMLDKDSSRVVISNASYNFDADASSSSRIAYSSNIAGSYDIWLYDSGRLTRLTDRSETESHPSITEDGNEVYYGLIQNGISNIWKTTIDDQHEYESIQVTFSKTGARYPVVYRAGQ